MEKNKLLPEGDKALCDSLVKAGMITREKCGHQGFWIEVTDKGWDAMNRNLAGRLPNSKKTSKVFEAWLGHLSAYMRAQDVPLTEILGARAAQRTHGDKNQAKRLASPDHIRARIRKAYLDVTGGRLNTRALLSDMREKLRDIDRETLDEALKRMHLEEGTTLSGLNNPQEITQAIRNAGLSFKGEPMYVLWITK